MNHVDCLKFFEEIVQKAEEMYDYNFGDLELVIDPKPLRKNVLAFYRPSTATVHLNDVLLNTLNETTIKQTIIHEIAHHLTPVLFPRSQTSTWPRIQGNR